MFLSCGFDFYKSINAPHNQAKLFKKRKNAPLARALTAKLIETAEIIDTKISEPTETTPKVVIEGVPSDLFHDGEYKQYIPNPESLSFENLLQECLTKIKPGIPDANDYEAVIALLLSRIFLGDLSNLKIQENINEGRQRIDFVMTNNARNGFFGIFQIDIISNVHTYYLSVKIILMILKIQNSHSLCKDWVKR